MTVQPTEPASYLDGADPRLIVADMDGTLLDEHGRIPDALWPLLDVMRDRGIAFVPASGRQFFRLEEMFHRASRGMPFICENGTYVVRDGAEVSSCSLPREAVDRTVKTIREAGSNVGIVVAGKKSGYYERAEPEFLREVDKYYHRSVRLENLLDYDDDVNKVAIYDFGDAETGVFQDIREVLDDCAVVVSARQWVDVQNPDAHKGRAVRSLQEELGVTREQTVAFGDFLNDVEMLEASGMSFAMANAHPGVIEASRFIAPSNSENGVITVLRNLLGLE